MAPTGAESVPQPHGGEPNCTTLERHMSMVFCRGCGKQIHETAPTCPGCGAPQSIPQVNPFPVPKAVSDSWREVFALIEKAGGPSLRNASKLCSFGERCKVLLNVWALLFGPFYYVAKGMWKRAITYSLLMIAGGTAYEQIVGGGAYRYAFPIICAGLWMQLANISYYKLVVQDDRGWI
jgi:hypothetical protein